MMRAKQPVRGVLLSFTGVLLAGAVLVAGCDSDELEAVIVGLEAAAASLQQHESDDDLTFGEWLLEEFDD